MKIFSRKLSPQWEYFVCLLFDAAKQPPLWLALAAVGVVGAIWFVFVLKWLALMILFIVAVVGLGYGYTIMQREQEFDENCLREQNISPTAPVGIAMPQRKE